MHRLLEDATDEQRAAIQHRDGPAFVSAAPGSGKSRVITYRTAYLIDQGVAPNNIIGITFTNKAANVMKERVKKLVDPRLASKVWLSTFHSFCVRLMKANPLVYGVKRNFGIADESDSKQIVTLAIAHVTGATEQDVKRREGAGNVGHVRRWISAQKDLVLTPDDLHAQHHEQAGGLKNADFIPYYAEYQRLLNSNNLLDFDDLIMRVVLKLRNNTKEQEFFAQHLHYLMVDEYQDTNFAQFELIRLISHVRENVLICGDDDQSVYGWRGADIQNSNRFYKTFPQAKTFMLQTNFRSVPGIAVVANTVIKNNVRMHAKQIVTHKQGGASPTVVELENTEKEAAYIVGTIRDLVRAKKYDWKDFAVIYRIRSASRALEDESVAQNVPYRVIGAINFYSRAHIKDILAYCRLLVYPHDNSAFTRVYNKPARGIGPANFSRFAAMALQQEASLMKTLRQGHYRDVARGGALNGFRKLKQMYRDLREIGLNDTAAVIQRVVHQSGYMYLAQNIKDEDRSARMSEDLLELIDAAAAFDAAYEGKSGGGLESFLDHTTLMQRNDKERDDNVVTLMTAHASKGMEFPFVFVCNCTDGTMPLHPRSDNDEPLTPEQTKEHYEEERRVFYVAITRAEEQLLITYPKIRRFRDGVSNCYRSQFCREAGDSLGFVSMVDPNKPARVSYQQKNKRRKQRTSTTYSTRLSIPDGGASDIMALKERKRNGTATRGDLELLAVEEQRMRSVIERT